MKIRTLAAAAVMALGVQATCVANADAAILVATYTGTVASGYDITGLFGAPGTNLTGEAYTATYTINTANGNYYNYLPSYDELLGGSNYGSSSPVSATIKIDGHTQTVAGGAAGFAYDSPFTPETRETAEDSSFIGNILISNSITSYQYNTSSPSVLVALPLTGSDNYGSFVIETRNYNTGEYVDYAYATLDGPDTIQITAIPEPATWAMMLLGLGGLGMALRSRRQYQGIAAAA